MSDPYRRLGGPSGSLQIRQRRQRVTRERPTALERAYETLGEDVVRQFQTTYRGLDSKWNGSEHDQAEGMVLSLLRQEVPDAQIRAIFGVGGSMIARLKEVIIKGIETLHTRRDRPAPKHALSTEDIDFFRSVCVEWDVEDGFPCSHRGPRQYLSEPNMTWKVLWERYKQQAEDAGRRVIKYCRWTQYVHLYFPGVKLTRSKTDVCDACVRIEIALLSSNLSDVERVELEAEKRMHLGAAIDQRRAMTQFVKAYAAAHAPQQIVPSEIVPDHVESVRDDERTEQTGLPTMQIQIDDFGGSFALPVYGHKRPSADYFNLNLMLHNFVVADITSGMNSVFLYDERAQGKGADALCSLRLLHHLRVRERYLSEGCLAPEKSVTLLQILDNCVGQNKSRSVFKFYAMLSLLFYKKVVLLFLLPGHSHNVADRVVAWSKRKLKGVNVFDPRLVVDKMNETESVQAEFLDHRKADRPFFRGWDCLLSKYFKRMPDGYTGNYFFEFDAGVVSIRHLVTTADQELQTVSLIGDGDAQSISKAFLGDLFGEKGSLDGCSLRDIRLERQPLQTLTAKKVKSLALKYFSIPEENRSYYPAPPESEPMASDETTDSGPLHGSMIATSKRKLPAGAQQPTKKKVGRPTKITAVVRTPSILTFLKPMKIAALDKTPSGVPGDTSSATL